MVGKTADLISAVLHSPRPDVLMLARRLLGMLTSCQDIIPWASYRARSLQHLLLPFQDFIVSKRSKRVRLDPLTHKGLRWWTRPHRLDQGLPIQIHHRAVLFTDTSLQGWGAHTPEEVVQGRWSPSERTAPLNLQELKII